MKVLFPTNHNFYDESPIKQHDLTDVFQKSTKAKAKNLFDHTFELTTKHESLKQLKIFRFQPVKDKLKGDEQLILKLYKKEDGQTGQVNYFVQTGLFAGVVHYKGCAFNITCAYGKPFLYRMLNYVNDIYVDTSKVNAQQNTEEQSFQHILAHLFVHVLERAATLGLPQFYQQKTQRSQKVRGSVDINAYLRHDMPFQGKLTTKYREQSYVQEIIDVLYLACEKVKQVFGLAYLQPILNLYQLLKSQYSGRFVNQSIINRAKSHVALQNPMFTGFKPILEYAEILLNDWDLQNRNQGDKQTYGYLFDLSQLFEVYLEKLLSQHLPAWSVSGQRQLTLYPNKFYKRNIYPDLVLKHVHSDKVIVLDAKFKKMRLQYRDLDRSDFYQIHTYMQYYGTNLLFGGLIYPLSIEHNLKAAYSDYPCNDSSQRYKFIIDGIELNNANLETITIEQIMTFENAFIKRLQDLIDDSLSSCIISHNS